MKNKKFWKKDWIFFMWAIIALFLIINSFQIYSLSKKVDILTGDAVLDESNAEITIIEYSDFECPFCAKASITINQVLNTYGDKVKLVYKHFPLSFHQHAQKAAEAAECARDQEKFWEYHDKLFANQRALDVASLKMYASELGLNTARFNNCLDSGDKASVVKKDFEEGRSKGVTGTPAFFINGEQLSGAQPFEKFKEVIDRQLSGDSADIPPVRAPAPSPSPEPADMPVVKVSEDDDPFKGESNAPVTIIEFSDFECPFCERFFSQTLPQIEEKYIKTGKVKFVYRDFPLSFHQHAQTASEASECAHEQGKFWEYHDKIFLNQQLLSLENFKKWAIELGLDSTKFNECLTSGKYTGEVKKDIQEGSAAGVTGTPAFFINGIKITGARPFESFRAVIEAELAK